MPPDYAAEHAHWGLRVLGFSLDEPASLSAVWEVAAAWNFPMGLLGSAYAGGYGRIWRIPVNFTTDRNGLLADNGWDPREPTWMVERLDRIITPLSRWRAGHGGVVPIKKSSVCRFACYRQALPGKGRLTVLDREATAGYTDRLDVSPLQSVTGVIAAASVAAHTRSS